MLFSSHQNVVCRDDAITQDRMMIFQQDRLDEFKTLVVQHSPTEGVNLTAQKNFGTAMLSAPQAKHSTVDRPLIWVVAQGKKICTVGGKTYEYGPGTVMILLYPISMAAEVVEASPDNPFLGAGIVIDLHQMADVLAHVDRIDDGSAKPVAGDPSGIFSIPLSDSLLDPFIRLFKLLDNPRDVAMLGDACVDEIYYRLLCDEREGELRFLLRQRGEIQRISKAVSYIHQNLDKAVSVVGLAEMVHMGQTTFYENFRSVMHMSPLQYAKSVKLYEAQRLLRSGKNASEAGYQVGYNSPAQFSREYKRHFGYAPSATV
jgi:AraC-like DNA-binding protein